MAEETNGLTSNTGFEDWRSTVVRDRSRLAGRRLYFIAHSSPCRSMTFCAFGLSHEVGSNETREALRLSADAQRQLYETLDLGERGGFPFLSTCSRNEVCVSGRDELRTLGSDVWSSQADHSWSPDPAFRYENDAAVRHIVQVTSGLRSIVPGDDQILGQMTAADRRAVDHGRIRSVMHRLMHTAFRLTREGALETVLSDLPVTDVAYISESDAEEVQARLRRALSPSGAESI